MRPSVIRSKCSAVAVESLCLATLSVPPLPAELSLGDCFSRHGKTVRPQTAHWHSRQHCRDKESGQWRPVGTSKIERESHDERTETGRQDKRAKSEPERRAKRA